MLVGTVLVVVFYGVMQKAFGPRVQFSPLHAENTGDESHGWYRMMDEGLPSSDPEIRGGSEEKCARSDSSKATLPGTAFISRPWIPFDGQGIGDQEKVRCPNPLEIINDKSLAYFDERGSLVCLGPPPEAKFWDTARQMADC